MTHPSHNESNYTVGEMRALVAPLISTRAENIIHVALVATCNDDKGIHIMTTECQAHTAMMFSLAASEMYDTTVKTSDDNISDGMIDILLYDVFKWLAGNYEARYMLVKYIKSFSPHLEVSTKGLQEVFDELTDTSKTVMRVVFYNVDSSKHDR